MSEINNIKKQPQGKKDVDSKWAQCRFRWVAQLLIRLGWHNANPDNVKAGAIELDELKEEDKLPNCFNPLELEPLNTHAIAWWDVSWSTRIVSLVASARAKKAKEISP